MKQRTNNRFLKRALPNSWALTISTSLGILASGSAIALLATSAWLITAASEQPLFMYLGVAIVSVRMFAVGRSAFRYLERLHSHDSTFRMLSRLRVETYEELIPLAPAGLQRRGKGELLNAVVRDIDELQNLPLRVIQPLLTAGVLGIASVIFLAVLAPLAGVALLALLLLAVIVSYALTRILSRTSDQQLSPLRAKLVHQLLELIDNADVVQVFGIRGALEARFMQTDTALRDVERRTALVQSVLSSGIGFASGLASFFGLLAAAPLLGAELNGPFFTVVVLTPIAVFEVFSTVPQIFASWQRVASSAEGLETLIPQQLPAEIPQHPAQGEEVVSQAAHLNAAVEEVTEDEPLIELQNLSARWPESSAGVYGIDCTIRRGETLLIQGGSGSGKTTLAQVLVGFLSYQGSYRIAGQEVRDIHPDALRTVVGLVEQQAFIFNNTLRHNIDFANDTASDEELWDALERVDLAVWARERDGLETWLGETGSQISGGQAQRIALARALLAGSPILVLDEPTAHVQPELHQQVIESMVKAASGPERTVILISHVEVDPILINQRIQLAMG